MWLICIFPVWIRHRDNIFTVSRCLLLSGLSLPIQALICAISKSIHLESKSLYKNRFHCIYVLYQALDRGHFMLYLGIMIDLFSNGKTWVWNLKSKMLFQLVIYHWINIASIVLIRYWYGNHDYMNIYIYFHFFLKSMLKRVWLLENLTTTFMLKSINLKSI